MRIRRAADTDFAAVTDLLANLGRARVTSQNYAACREIYARQLADDNTDHMVAVDDDGAIVGFCSLHFRDRLNHDRPQAWVADLIVQREARGRGTARALLERAEQLAAERGCWEITLEASYNNSEAQLLYTAAGMKDSGRYFSKPV